MSEFSGGGCFIAADKIKEPEKVRQSLRYIEKRLVEGWGQIYGNEIPEAGSLHFTWESDGSITVMHKRPGEYSYNYWLDVTLLVSILDQWIKNGWVIGPFNIHWANSSTDSHYLDDYSGGFCRLTETGKEFVVRMDRIMDCNHETIHRILALVDLDEAIRREALPS